MIELGLNDSAAVVNEWVTAGRSRIEGNGLFARRRIPAGTAVIEYVGERITKIESVRRCAANNPYIFSFDEEHDIDGDVPYNLARWVNHSCAPNCETEILDHRIWIVAQRDISAGEEITFNYGYDLEDFREHPCRCGASGCIGYMVAEEYFPIVRRTPFPQGEPRVETARG